MAEHVRLIKLTWENEVGFEMETKLDGDSYLTVTSMDENGYFANLWEKGVAFTCKEYFDSVIDTIGAEMKA